MPTKEKKVLKFKLNEGVGPHFEPNPDFDPEQPESEENFRDMEYAPGEIVKSVRPLDRIFVNKFTPLAGAATGGKTAGGDAAPEDPEQDPNAGRAVRDTEAALHRSADRFLEEEELEGQPEQLKLLKGKKAKAAAPEDEDEEEVEEEGGSEDVTSDFEGAAEGGLQVFKDSDGKYHVHNEGESEPIKGSVKGFSTKKKTAAFVNAHAQSSEEEE